MSQFYNIHETHCGLLRLVEFTFQNPASSLLLPKRADVALNQGWVHVTMLDGEFLAV